MTLNSFFVNFSIINVTLGISRLYEVIMTASANNKTTMLSYRNNYEGKLILIQPTQYVNNVYNLGGILFKTQMLLNIHKKEAKYGTNRNNTVN